MSLKSDAEKMVATMIEVAPKPIENLDEFHAAATTLLVVRKQRDGLTAEKDELTRPHRQAIDKTNEDYAVVKDLGVVEDALKESLGSFVDRRLVESLVEAQLAATQGNRVGLALANRPIPATPGVEYRSKASVEVEDLDAVPDEYIETERKVSKEALARVLKKGVIPGLKRVERTSVTIVTSKGD